MKKRNIMAALLLGMVILAGCSTGEKIVEEAREEPQEVVENVKRDLGEMPKTDNEYTPITKEEFKDLAMEYGLIPLDDDVINGQGFISKNMGMVILDSPVMDAETEEAFKKAKEDGHKLFRVMYLFADGEDFNSTTAMFTDSEEDFEVKDGMLGKNSLSHLSYIEDIGAYSLLSIVDNTVITVESFDKESIFAYAQLIGYPFPESGK